MTSPRLGRFLFGLGLSALCLSLATGGDAAQNVSPADDNSAMRLVFLGQTRPVLLQVNITIDGKSVSRHWHDYLQKWFALLDGDDNGTLDAAEAARAPTTQTLVQIASQSAFFGAGFDPRAKTTPVNFRTPPGRGVSREEFQDFYTAAVAPVQFQSQNDTGAFYKQVSTSLFSSLDANKDGKLSKDEVDSARIVLRKYDLEDTEWITAQNLAPAFSDPIAQRAVIRLGTGMTQPETKSDSFFQIRRGTQGLPALLLARYDKAGTKKLDREQSGLDTATFRRLDTNEDRGLDAEELAHWHERPADFEITLPIAKPGGPPVQFQIRPQSPVHANALKPTPAGTMLELDDAHINMSAVDSAGIFLRPPNLNYLQILRGADTKKQGFITMKDLQEDRRALQILGQAFTFADRNRDDKLTEKELQAFVELQSQSGDAFATVSMADQGRVIFQHLDANKDNRLSLRELQNAWTRLSSFDVNGDGFIEERELARQFQLSAQKGQVGIGVTQVVALSGPRGAPMARPAPGGPIVPAWFSKMDKNGDGDVSRREFLGLTQDFARIDSDGDGFISAEEAVRFDPRPPQARRER